MEVYWIRREFDYSIEIDLTRSCRYFDIDGTVYDLKCDELLTRLLEIRNLCSDFQFFYGVRYKGCYRLPAYGEFAKHRPDKITDKICLKILSDFMIDIDKFIEEVKSVYGIN